ncbi:dihydroneopterin triphosphate diphosphatase [Pseudoalteromonas ruthenica]|uniref:dihydroneopterin triphosphate diphosphatase n=1 Tax=Pseudoalteromonas ruthenica TaxID=151081 RepID=UPI0012472AB1|nr:dihydroneopterin triphosphate diphosphatase [Pseudoalteromonas ruthenica]
MSLRQPYSVLVVIYTLEGEFLLLQRADDPEFWQSVTGGIDEGELPCATAAREVFEETGIDISQQQLRLVDEQRCHRYAIREQWRYRYQPGATVNTEYVFSLCLPKRYPIQLAADEHLSYLWLDANQACDKAWSASNAQEIRTLALALAHNSR